MTTTRERALPFEGLTRREFVGYCGVIAAMTGLGSAAIPDIAAALEQLAKRPQVVWSDFQECTGCSVQLLQSRKPDPATLILQTISLEYHEVVMAAPGMAAEEQFEKIVGSGDFYWVVEGSIATKPPEAITIAGKTAADIVKDTYTKAKGIIAIGNCACYGNVQASRPNPTGAKGVYEYIGQDLGDQAAADKVINIARCPGQAEDMVAALSYVLVTGKLPELDSVNRPVFLYGQLIHDNCERRGHFEAGEFVETFGDEGSAKNWCLYKVGCKGPQSYAPCPTNRWNGGLSWPVRSGGPCIGCSEPDFWDKLTPFYSRAQEGDVPGIGGVSAQTIGIGLGAATAVGLGAHLVGQAATGRLGHGGPMEDETAAVEERR